MTFRRVAAALGLALGIALPYSPQLGAQAGVRGRWTTLPSLMPINPVHVALMHNGKVLIVAGSGNVATETNYQAAVWDPETGSIVTQPVAWDMFCNGMVILPDGRVFINGGNLQYDPFHGSRQNAVFDPATGLFTDVAEHGARPLVSDGNRARRRPRHDFLRPERNRRDEHRGGDLHGGIGLEPGIPRRLDPAALSAHAPAARRNGVLFGLGHWLALLQSVDERPGSARRRDHELHGTRTYGTSVLLPLTPANGYKPRVMIIGGGNPATATTEIIDCRCRRRSGSRAADVAGAHRDECDDPAQRQGAGAGRIHRSTRMPRPRA